MMYTTNNTEVSLFDSHLKEDTQTHTCTSGKKNPRLQQRCTAKCKFIQADITSRYSPLQPQSAVCSLNTELCIFQILLAQKIMQNQQILFPDEFIIINSYSFLKGYHLSLNPIGIRMGLRSSNAPVSRGDQKQTHTAPSVMGSILFPLFLSISTASGA